MHAMFLRVSPKKGDLALSAHKSFATTLRSSVMESASKSSNKAPTSGQGSFQITNADCKINIDQDAIMNQNFQQTGLANQNKFMSGSKLQVRKMEYVAQVESLDENIDDLDGSLEKFIGQEISHPNTHFLNLKSQRRKITDDFGQEDQFQSPQRRNHSPLESCDLVTHESNEMTEATGSKHKRMDMLFMHPVPFHRMQELNHRHNTRF